MNPCSIGFQFKFENRYKRKALFAYLIDLFVLKTANNFPAFALFYSLFLLSMNIIHLFATLLINLFCWEAFGDSAWIQRVKVKISGSETCAERKKQKIYLSN